MISRVCFDTHDITSPVSIIVILAENSVIGPQPVEFSKKIFERSTQVDYTILDLFDTETISKEASVTNSLSSFKYHELQDLRGYVGDR